MRESFRSFNDLFCTFALEELSRLGVKDVFIAPGSRSTPLVFAAEENSHLRKHVHFDERGLGFFALGCAKKTKKPVVIITTSGTAAANLYPAIIEAQLTHVPLIVCTGDRPFELRNTGANQAINQMGMFNHVVEFYDIPVPSAQFPLESLLTTLDDAVFQAQSKSFGGPVHLNWMFQEPLAPPIDQSLDLRFSRSIREWLTSQSCYTRDFDNQGDQGVSDEVKNIIKNSKNGLIVVGGQEENLKLEDFTDLKWPIFFDIQSSLRMQKVSGSIPYWDLLLEFQEVKPDCVIWFGGAVTNRKGLEFVKELNCPVIQVHPYERRLDPHHLSKFHVVSSGKNVLNELKLAQKSRDYDALGKLQKKIESFLESEFETDEALTEPSAVYHISKSLKDVSLFLASSRPIRDFQRFGVAGEIEITSYSNRGASGIDGNLATIAGIALTSEKPTVAVVGDLATLHDLNSLSLVAQSKSPILLVVINNDGGGIFSFLPVSQHKEVFEKYWGTPHGYNFQHFAKSFNLRYKQVATQKELHECLKNFEFSQIVEIQTNREKNFLVHQRIVEKLKAYLLK